MNTRPVLAGSLAVTLLAGACRRAPELQPRTVVIGQVTSAIGLDPHLHDEESTHSALSHFYERLVAFGPDLDIRPELAVQWTNPSDTVWRFTLREGVLFHDGTPLTAEDVVASLRRAQRLPGSQVIHYLRNVASVTALSSREVEVVTSSPSPLLLNKLAFVAVVPRSAPDHAISHPVGTGPYRFVSGAPRNALEGEVFERYWGQRPAFPRFRVVPLPDARSRAHAIVEGRADVVSRLPFEFAPWARGQKKLRLASRVGLGVAFLGFSLRERSPYRDRRVREAFALAIDRTRMIEAPESEYTVNAEQFVPGAVFGYAPPSRPWVHDAARARTLLAEAGHRRGMDATLVLPDAQASLGARLGALLGEAGIRVRVETLPWDEYYVRWSGGGLDLFGFAYTAGTGDASDLLDAAFHSPSASSGALNSSGYSSAAFDRLVDDSGCILDPYDRRRLMNEALAILREDLPAIPLVVRSNLYAVSDEITWAARQDRRVRAQDMRPRATP
ncbi:MAG TPA: ABC transporter substrate-binding protein [Thermoanaerobaculia bacterium]|nr:ABC transporter substrate-binding protein [Thermoanaerobaculia bacterium]